VAEQGLTVWSVPGTEIAIAKVSEGERAGEFLFTACTVRRAQQFFKLVQDRTKTAGTSDMLATWWTAPGLMLDVVALRLWELPRAAFTPRMGQPLSKWAAMLHSIAATVDVAWLFGRSERK
jgi:MscS family membrane protein